MDVQVSDYRRSAFHFITLPIKLVAHEKGNADTWSGISSKERYASTTFMKMIVSKIQQRNFRFMQVGTLFTVKAMSREEEVNQKIFTVYYKIPYKL